MIWTLLTAVSLGFVAGQSYRRSRVEYVNREVVVDRVVETSAHVGLVVSPQAAATAIERIDAALAEIPDHVDGLYYRGDVMINGWEGWTQTAVNGARKRIHEARAALHLMPHGAATIAREPVATVCPECGWRGTQKDDACVNS